jgi:hypothetical protein
MKIEQMFRSFSCTRYRFAARGGCLRSHRNFSLISVHRTFPATLYRFQLQRESTLYDKKLREDDQDFNDAIEVPKDGLVRPGIIGDGARMFLSCILSSLKLSQVSNGALFIPNTHYMQELTRMHYDYYLDAVENGKPTADPHYLCLPKGKKT